MTTENQVSTAPETQIPASEPTVISPEIVEPGSTDSEASDGDGSEAKPEKTAEQKEIERLRRQLTKRDRTQGKLYQEVQTYRQQLEQIPREQGQPQQQQRSADPYEIAREIALIDKITEKSNAIAKDGQTRFTDFNASLGKVIEEVGDLFNERGHPTPVGEALLESDDTAALIDFLGRNPDIATELEGLSPTKLGRRIERIEAQMKSQPVKPVSRASEPISPIRGGQGNVVKSFDNMSPSEYKAAREKMNPRWAR